jgi:hypothetical protein
MEGISSVSEIGVQGGSVKCERGVACADGDRDEVAATMTPCPVEVAHGHGGAGGEEGRGGEERGHKMDVDKGADAAILPKSLVTSLPKGDYATEGFV